MKLFEKAESRQRRSVVESSVAPAARALAEWYARPRVCRHTASVFLSAVVALRLRAERGDL